MARGAWRSSGPAPLRNGNPKFHGPTRLWVLLAIPRYFLFHSLGTSNSMKKLPVLLVLVSAHCAVSSSVLWNTEFNLSQEITSGGSNRNIWWLTIDLLEKEENVYMDFAMEIEKSGYASKRTLSGVNGDVARAWWIVVAEVDDEINSETGKDSSKLFFTNTNPSADIVKREYTVRSPWTMYLGITITHWGNWNSILEEYIPPHEVYGWVELIVDGDALRLGDTCLDLSGRPVVVGVRSAEPIPEPASGALALFGAALLFRRRSRRPIGVGKEL